MLIYHKTLKFSLKSLKINQKMISGINTIYQNFEYIYIYIL